MRGGGRGCKVLTRTHRVITIIVIWEPLHDEGTRLRGAYDFRRARDPDGILAGAPLNDGISPTQGRDMSGPTAAMNSVAKLHQALSGEENLQRLADMIKIYFSKGGGQVQFNATSTDTLKEARKVPDKHRNLMVGVVGYAALFVELSAAVQDDLIQRTQYTECG